MNSEEILINVTPQETRVAIVENGTLQEVCIERRRNRGIVGNIYKGKVNRVLPGMEAAFVDIGLERSGFLHVSDFDLGQTNDDDEPVVTPPINQLLHEGQSILVQVVKDPLGTKGARLTTSISVPSRYLVYMPNSSLIGISVKIEEDDERERLRTLLSGCMTENRTGGCIVRTAAEGVVDEELNRDIKFLCTLWDSLQEQAKTAKPGTVIHEDLSLSVRTLRDMVGNDTDLVKVDSRETYQKLTNFADKYIPDLPCVIEHYPGDRPLFDLYNIDDEIQRALGRKVELKSGGYLIIDQTEAMTTIDINTGAFVGHHNLEETIFKTNMEASQALARQLRLRNLGGIIIIDFIDMVMEDHKRQVLKSLEKYLDKDHAKTQVCEVSPLGLVEMTRKRTRESLEHILCESCATCGGRGTHKTVETVCYEIFREILREARVYDEAQQLLVMANQDVIDTLLDEEATSLAELETFVKIPVKLQVESYYSQENYDVVPV
ncbi:MAG: ribonuclease G [Gammaproteobacteria bacterium]|jgi:ribonuclease G|nr:ribonuclease G [Gammaproteobacteria bacterium]MBT3724816.1 ribonuclease G [Gammaproteobacteria bacterium]MBT4078078.1 ribonuclease G [Gammaproteobacteria bacterium]MBT4193824.1 ribonuclease G [Gammaproteobacteria bacterium]MBT4452150.1 ribonuclease G [Gammaproteobacteria bacterium]